MRTMNAPSPAPECSTRAIWLAGLNEIPRYDIDKFVSETVAVRRDPSPRFHCCQNHSARVLEITSENSDRDTSEARRNWNFILGDKNPVVHFSSMPRLQCSLEALRQSSADRIQQRE